MTVVVYWYTGILVWVMRLWEDSDPQYKPIRDEAGESLDRLVVLKLREPT